MIGFQSVDHARRGQTTHPQSKPGDGPSGVHDLTSAPREPPAWRAVLAKRPFVVRVGNHGVSFLSPTLVESTRTSEGRRPGSTCSRGMDTKQSRGLFPKWDAGTSGHPPKTGLLGSFGCRQPAGTVCSGLQAPIPNETEIQSHTPALQALKQGPSWLVVVSPAVQG